MEDAKKILGEIKPVIRDIFWISQCWNDHNFSEKDLLDKCEKISKILLGDDLELGDVDRCNEWIEKVDKICSKTQIEKPTVKEPVRKKIIKSSGPDKSGIMRGHCYDSTGYDSTDYKECSFWKYGHIESRCMLWGGCNGVLKQASKSLNICDKIFGTNFEGEV